MQNFTFSNPTNIIFGKNSEAGIADEVRKYNNKILLHYGSGSIKKSGLYDRITAALKLAGIEFVELAGVKPNPRLSMVYEGIKLCREHNIDFVLAVGGGSVIDSAKAIAIGVPYTGDVWDMFTGKMEVKETLPVGVVLTIPAAGSETSGGSVITNENGWYKKVAGHMCMIPKFAIMNPELTYTLPDYQTACGAVDIMAHIMERYFTTEKNVDFTDRLCEATLKTVIKYTPLALSQPNNYDYRAEIMWAGTIAHNGLLDTGRIADWASHMIEHEISGIYDVAHGAGLAVIFPAWMRYVYKHDITRFAQFAVRVWNVEYSFENPEATALEGISRMEAFFKGIGLPIRLNELGIDEERLQEMADKATKSGNLGNFVKLNAQDIFNILKFAL